MNSKRVILLIVATTCVGLNFDVKFASAQMSCDSSHDLEYELFGTKTVYDDARNFLRRTNEDDLPSSYDDDSISDEHKEMLEDKCTPLVFYFVGRHSARFPDSEDIEKYNKDLDELMKRVKAGIQASRTSNCKWRIKEMLEWRSKMQAKQDNLITDLGGKEEREIARRFKRIYPEFFNTLETDVQIGVTNKIRSAQTAAEFLKEVEGLNLPGCEANAVPTNDVDEPAYNLDRILKAPCYKSLMAEHSKPFLDFHKQCEMISGESSIKDPLVERARNPQVKRFIGARVARKLGLDHLGEDAKASASMLDSIFNMCKFENALKNDSIWCNLFDKYDIEALEYIEDVSTYLKDAYGPKANTRQSCPLVKNLIDALHQAIESNPSDKKKAYFYFSHAEPIKKLLATFGLFRDDSSFTSDKISEFEQDLSVPHRRNWRSSVITPFSANMVFVLYKCQKPGKPVKYKLLSSVTEQPVKLAGCQDEECNIERFFEKYGHLRNNCDLNKICAKSWF